LDLYRFDIHDLVAGLQSTMAARMDWKDPLGLQETNARPLMMESIMADVMGLWIARL